MIRDLFCCLYEILFCNTVNLLRSQLLCPTDRHRPASDTRDDTHTDRPRLYKRRRPSRDRIRYKRDDADIRDHAHTGRWHRYKGRRRYRQTRPIQETAPDICKRAFPPFCRDLLSVGKEETSHHRRDKGTKDMKPHACCLCRRQKGPSGAKPEDGSPATDGTFPFRSHYTTSLLPMQEKCSDEINRSKVLLFCFPDRKIA